jgi:hypothetical protein
VDRFGYGVFMTFARVSLREVPVREGYGHRPACGFKRFL